MGRTNSFWIAISKPPSLVPSGLGHNEIRPNRLGAVLPDKRSSVQRNDLVRIIAKLRRFVFRFRFLF